MDPDALSKAREPRSDARPVDGFPWDKVWTARAYLLALKPWLSPIAMTVTLVPVDQPPVTPGMGWMCAPQTDRRGRTYLDRSFCQQVELHVLAGALEHEYAKVSRGVADRLDWVSVEDWDEVGALALHMEIVDAMEDEGSRMSEITIERRIIRSRQRRLSRLPTGTKLLPPSLVPAGATRPEDVGLRPGLTAETYARALLAMRDGLQPGPGVALDEDREDLVAGSSASGQLGDARDGSDPGGSSPGSEGDASDSADSAENQADAASGPASQDARPDTDGGATGQAETEGADGQGRGEEGDGGATPAPEEADSATGGGEGEGEGEGGSGDGDAQASKPSGQARRGELSVQQRAWVESFPHPDDPFARDLAPPRDDNATPASPAALSTALDQSATLARECAKTWGVGSSTLTLAAQRLRGRALSWESTFSRLISAALMSERVRGANDVSYSHPNANQPAIGVRLPGLIDYSPTVTVVQDVSGSMATTMGHAMDVVGDLMTAVTTRFGASTTWVSVDDGIIDVGTAPTLSKNVQKRIGRGGGGTNLGHVITALMGKGPRIRFGGRPLEVPDLLVVSTDGFFQWPKQRPSRAHRLVVVLYDERQRRALPSWLDRGEVVVAGTDRTPRAGGAEAQVLSSLR